MAFQPDKGTFYKIADLEEAGIGGIVTIRKWIKTGRLKASLVGRDYMILGEDIIDFLKSGSGVRKSGVNGKD